MLIVFNPAAGARRRRRLARALRRLAEAGILARVAETLHPGHATDLARIAAGQGEPLVVAAGGDGTIAEVAAGLAGSAARLGILPFGTANVLAWELGLPPRPEAAAEVLAQGRPVVLRPGFARFGDGTERLFVQMLGAGFDAQVVARLDLGLKRRLGRGAAARPAAGHAGGRVAPGPAGRVARRRGAGAGGWRPGRDAAGHGRGCVRAAPGDAAGLLRHHR
ncbi:diacylglycerol/lipid kinase family protein [Paracraurococcus lichenis]|uniref:Diacylglycerol kinase family protein n=1 Tax=Paracraurococcus lichenis TaxID=3064888 RepID=A0ABT9E2H7_9PROT|nr:diacylglycerol kinase family protein [Paracraurococcus sp. LOR1-02]MDO9710205.1 diacylglycerol kinase family protein [Paracraurococcus sp. LOR1-02]